LEIGPNSLLIVELPAYGTFLPFKVIDVTNMPYDELDYSPLPITTSTSLGYFTPTVPPGAPLAAPQTGVLPPMSYTASPVMFPLQNSFDPSDMFYFESPNNKLMVVELFVQPRFLRVMPEIPAGNIVASYENTIFNIGGSIQVNVGNFTGLASTGFKRGYSLVVQLPKVHYGYLFGNDTSLTVYTFAKIRYYDLRVAAPTPTEVLDAFKGKVKDVEFISLPIPTVQTVITNVLNTYYGTTGIPFAAVNQEQIANFIKPLADKIGGV